MLRSCCATLLLLCLPAVSMAQAQADTQQWRWLVALWNELFVTLDDTRAGPPQGVDRNRLFGGVRRRLAQQASLEVGYLWQATRPRVGARQDAHAAFVWLDLVF